MKIAETVTFGGGDLNRAAHLRTDIDTLVAKTGAKATLFWRGKVLMADAGGLAMLETDHAVLQSSVAGPVFLGLGANEVPILAYELSDWTPSEAPDDAFLDQTRQAHPAVENAGFAELRGIMFDLTTQEAELAATGRSVLEWHKSHKFCARCGQESQMAMAGWQRDCSACGGHHFPRTDPVVIMLITHGNSVLVGRSPGWPEGMYSLLAGFVEPGETVEAAVRREVFEEAGVRVGPVSYLASQPWAFPSSLMIGCAGEALGRDITIDPAEIEAAVWVTREEIADVFAGEHSFINAPRKGAIAGFLLENWLADRLD